MSKTKSLKIKQSDNSYVTVSIGADALNIDLSDGTNLQEKINELEENQGSGDGILTGTIVGWDDNTAIPEGYEIYEGEAPTGGSTLPIGVILPYYGSTAPEEFLLCNGSSYNTADYPELASLLGATGSTFTTPNLVDKFLRGGTTPGTTGGSNTAAHSHTQASTTGSHTLTTEEIPSHTHTYTDYYATSSKKNTWDITKTASSVTSVSNTSTTRTSNASGSGNGHTHTLSATNSTTIDTVPEYITVNYIIKAK